MNRSDYGFVPHSPGQPDAINADSFAEDVLEARVPVLVEFWAARCGPCRRLIPELAAVRERFGNTVRVFTVNVDEEPGAAVACDVRTIPATLLFINGREVARRVGLASADELATMLSAALAGTLTAP